MRLFSKKPVFEAFYPSQAYKDVHRVLESKEAPPLALQESGAKDRNYLVARKCPAMYLQASTGFVVRQPYSFQINVHSDGSHSLFCEDDSLYDMIDVHPFSQYQPMYENYVAVKARNLLHIRESTGTQCVYMPAFTKSKNLNMEMWMPTGVVDFRANNDVHLFYLFRIPNIDTVEYKVESGDPVLHILPMTDSWSMKHTVDPDFASINNTVLTQPKGRYATLKRALRASSNKYI